MTDIIAALLSENWILSAVLLYVWMMERQERIKDKANVREERLKLTEELHSIVTVLVALKERIK